VSLMERNEGIKPAGIVAAGAREKCLPSPAEDWPGEKSTRQGGSPVKEDKPNKPIPQEAEGLANRLLYGAQKAKEPQAGTDQARQDQEEVEWVASWTFGTVPRLAAKTKIGVEKWADEPPDRIKTSHLYEFEPSIRHLKKLFGDFIVKYRDFRLRMQPKGTWFREHPPPWMAPVEPVEPVAPSQPVEPITPVKLEDQQPSCHRSLPKDLRRRNQIHFPSGKARRSQRRNQRRTRAIRIDRLCWIFHRILEYSAR
jgi:hypothetical protein